MTGVAQSTETQASINEPGDPTPAPVSSMEGLPEPTRTLYALAPQLARVAYAAATLQHVAWHPAQCLREEEMSGLGLNEDDESAPPIVQLTVHRDEEPAETIDVPRDVAQLLYRAVQAHSRLRAAAPAEQQA